MRRLPPLAIALAALASCSHHDVCGPDSCPWTQWGQNAAHLGQSCGVAQSPTKLLADVTVDPFTQDEEADDPENGLVVHYQAPLVQCDDVYVELKSGQFTQCKPPGSGQPAPCGWEARGSQKWSEARYHWDGSSLSQRWTFDSDWTPPPTYFEPVFQPALGGDYLYVPGAGGTVFQLEKESGKALNRFNPFGTSPDPTTFVAGPLTTDAAGNVYYTAVQYLAGDSPDGRGWLIEISAAGDVTQVGFETLTIGAPAATAQCGTAFPPSTPAPLPPPPHPDGSPVLPSTVACGAQRPALNVAPTIGPDGTIYVVSRAHNAKRYAYLVAVAPDLTPLWKSSLRDRLHDGCGVLATCRAGTPMGIDPTTNDTPAGEADDDSSSSPVALPDGTVLYGALTFYNDDRGHLMKFAHDGSYQGDYDFGWDVTPAVSATDGGYSIFVKDNHYDGTEGYFITRLGPSLGVEWQFRSTNTQSCTRKGSKLSCTDDHPGGFEWCTNAPALDGNGTLWVTSEDGNLYGVSPDGGAAQSFFLDMSLGAAYTPTTIDAKGRIYAMNAGHLLVVGAGK